MAKIIHKTAEEALEYKRRVEGFVNDMGRMPVNPLELDKWEHEQRMKETGIVGEWAITMTSDPSSPWKSLNITPAEITEETLEETIEEVVKLPYEGSKEHWMSKKILLSAEEGGILQTETAGPEAEKAFKKFNANGDIILPRDPMDELGEGKHTIKQGDVVVLCQVIAVKRRIKDGEDGTYNLYSAGEECLDLEEGETAEALTREELKQVLAK